MAPGREGSDAMVTTDTTLRLLWRPRAIARVAVPLLLVLILAWTDRQWVSSPKSLLRGWHDLAHYGLVVVGVLIAVYAVRIFTESLGGALEGYLGLGRAHSAAKVVSVILFIVVIM